MPAPTLSQAILKVENVCRSCSFILEDEDRIVEIPILDNFSLEIMAGERYALMGPSGAGKTTVLEVILGLQATDVGSVQLFGKPLDWSSSSSSPNSIYTSTGFMPQSELGSEIQDLNRTVEETIRDFGRRRGMTTGQLSQRIETLKMGYLDTALLSCKLASLSPSEQRLIHFFAVTIHSPKILLLDEPTVNLEKQSKEILWKVVEEMSGNGTAVLMVTHDSEEAMKATKVGFMRKGRMLLEGSPQHLLSSFSAEDLEDVWEQVSIQDELTKICLQHGLSHAISDLAELFALSLNVDQQQVHNDI